MAICERCGKEHDGSYASGRFCSKHCACSVGGLQRNKLHPQKEKINYIEKICEKCGKEFTLENNHYNRKRRFCSRACANSRIITNVVKDKIRASLEMTRRKKNNLKRQGRKENYNYTYVQDNPQLDLPIHTCKICGKQFYHTYLRKTCKDFNCKSSFHKQVQKDIWKNKSKIHYKKGKEWTEDACKQIYKYYFTYKITNLVNGKYYLGIHATDNLEDGYMGSGINIKKALKKYGKNNFKKEILEYFCCYKDLAEAEYKLITKEVLEDKNNYNLTSGGIGGPCFRGKHHSEETLNFLKQNSLLRKHMYNPITLERALANPKEQEMLLKSGWVYGMLKRNNKSKK